MVYTPNQTRREWINTCAVVVGGTAVAGCVEEDNNDNSNGKNSNQDPNWPMYGIDVQNTGYQPNVSGPEGDNIELREVYDIGGGSSYPVVTAGDHIYVTSRDGVVLALNRETEELIWEAEGHGPLMVFEDRVYGPRGSHRIYGYDREDGVRWESDEIDLQRSLNLNNEPIVTEDGIFVISDHNVWKIDIDTGEYISVREYPRDSRDLTGTTDIPAYNDGVLYHAMGIELFALDIESGEHKWSVESENVLHIGNPSVFDDIIYVPGGGKMIYAFDIDSGKELWTVEIYDSIEERPTVAEELIYIDDGQKLTAIDSHTGEIDWDVETPAGTNEVVVANETVYSSDIFGLRAHDMHSGTLKWEFEIEEPTEDGFSTPPAVFDDAIYCISTNGKLYSLEDT
ncbi:PQQ-like beta-propeller repeat protein [Natronorubrum daqingense]|uniref:Outer membrane protein assembly factor BamB, contains PQQ-like beta-propeller repeat n=2 Tax=Natronorubrum daqingense TaxID=588898 RepID=A0A1N7ED62_9EURY|nr:PQQ-binding-like beta-propeller repeat protein [Natronorubrum daqingense]SIR85908.1 Outer membrane protein assembly factor BamB, contains PQQ-like beta-propeller repeat [Natronorubrum daqingense]